MTTPVQSSQVPAFVRTAVPGIVAFFLTKYALPIDGVTANLIAQAVVAYVYYVLVHLVEIKYPSFGFLLGIAKAPAYSQGEPPQPPPPVPPADGGGGGGGDADVVPDFGDGADGPPVEDEVP